MANTYVLIQATELTGTQTTVTFSSIPSTYTDLVLKCSIRNNEAGVTIQQLNVTFDTTANTAHSRTQISGNSGTAASSRTSNATNITVVDGISATDSTANTFSNVEIYVPNYTASTNKPISIDTAAENNSASVFYRIGTAGYWRNTAAVSTIRLTGGGASFAANSTFYLYGIKNA